MTKIFVNGTFDVLHLGHLALLEYAHSLGTVMVAIDSDARIKQLKGAQRPVNTLVERITMLEALRCVDSVRVFDTDQDLIDIIRAYQPNIMVKGSDYQGRNIIGAEHCDHIDFFPRLDDYSTTKKIQNIAHRR
jgi:D-beta-D-heptose 7-phosphate kinase/D-beta-D-heptose 1-phosphate adenosyltransferase